MRLTTSMKITANSNSKGFYLYTLILVVIFATSLFLLIASLDNLKHSFLSLKEVNARLVLSDCSINGMTVECYGNITIDSTIPYEIELIQLSMSNEEGKDMGSWTADYVRNAGKDFLIKISDVQIFEEFRDGDSKVYLEGFVKVKFDIGRYGMKLDIPLKAEVSTFGKEG